MATYKLIQDIEAEDHILGPLTLRQFIYALVAIFCFYMCFIAIAKHVLFLLAIFVLPGLFFGFLAFPFGKDQPTEIWALAKLRFLFKPRKRIWNQSGIKELVTITVPKKVERNYTDGLSQLEVKSRLKTLANTIDSRGWAIKNVNVNLYNQPGMVAPGTDRLIDIGTIPRPVPEFDVAASDDILDEQSNPVAAQFNQMIGVSSQTHRQELIDKLNEVRAEQSAQGDNYWFLNPGGAQQGSTTAGSPAATPASDDAQVTADEEAVVTRLKKHNASQAKANAHLRTIRPLGHDKAKKPAADTGRSTSGTTPDPAILELANNNDLNVATLAREANKAKGSDDLTEGKVIPLH